MSSVSRFQYSHGGMLIIVELHVISSQHVGHAQFKANVNRLVVFATCGKYAALGGTDQKKSDLCNL